jgi:thiol peroxidase
MIIQIENDNQEEFRKTQYEIELYLEKIGVSKDLPFALGRFCASEGLQNVMNLSDYRGNFGETYGLTIADSPLKGLLSRAVVVLDENGTVKYTEQVPEIAQEPNYAAALEAVK